MTSYTLWAKKDPGWCLSVGDRCLQGPVYEVTARIPIEELSILIFAPVGFTLAVYHVHVY